MNTKISNLLQKYDHIYQQKLALIDFNQKVVPSKDLILNTFNLIENDIKVVILGQDPYYVPGFANGLAFSVNKNCKIPRSLQNIFKELKSFDDSFNFENGDLSLWAKQGVLLLNTCLTTIEGKALAHKHVNWEEYTTLLISEISKFENVVFILLGNNAIKYQKYINSESNLVLTTSHPSPLSARRGFFGSNVFNKTNEYLKNVNKKTINWNLTKEV